MGRTAEEKRGGRSGRCPGDPTLLAFQLGDLPEEALDAVGAHLESCPACEARAEALDGRTDPVLDDLRRAAIASPAPAPGTPDLPDYEIDPTPLGVGGMGVVYRARHLTLGRVVALKMLARRSEAAAALFRIEAKAVARLQHPNIVQIFEIGHHEGRPFLALEYVGGGSLDRWIEGRPLPPRAAAELVRALALAADAAHRLGIVHCDLKPSNILMTPDGVPKIADFGVAKWLESGALWREEGDIIGTPRYMAPEQAGGRVASVGPAADIYSLGVILRDLTGGGEPDDRPEGLDLDPPPRARGRRRGRRPKVPRDLEAILRRCLRADPADRYGDARGLADDLGRFLAGEPARARPIGPAARVLRAARRRPAPVGVLAVTALALALAALGEPRWGPRATAGRRAAPAARRGPTPGDPLGTIVQADGSIRLGAAAAAVHGRSLAFEPPFGNLGYWHSPDDRARWDFRIDRPATFDVALEYSNANGEAGNRYQVRVDGLTLTARAAGTGAWTEYRPFRVGEAALAAGVHRLEVRPSGPLDGALFDLRAVVLSPRP